MHVTSSHVELILNKKRIMEKLMSRKSQILNTLLCVLLLGLTFSCKPKKVIPIENPILIARADMNFVDDDEVYAFRSYKDLNFQQVILAQDTSLTLRFKDGNENGNLSEGIILLITLYNKNGFSVGQTYKASDNSADQTIWIHSTKPDGSYLNYYAGNNFPTYNSGLAELKITAYDGKNLKGIFSFTAHSTNELVAEKELIVTNGAFNVEVK